MKPSIAIAVLLLTGCAAHRPVVAVPTIPASTCPANADICITADQMPADATRAMFGPLRREYGSAAVMVCSRLSTSTTVPLAYVESQYTNRSGTSVIPSLVAQSVIAHAQQNTKLAIGMRVGLIAVEGAAVATQLATIGVTAKAVLTDIAVDGSSLYNILASNTVSTSMQTYSAVTLPATLEFQPHGCVSGIVLDHVVSGAPAAGSVSFGVVLPK